MSDLFYIKIRLNRLEELTEKILKKIDETYPDKNKTIHNLSGNCTVCGISFKNPDSSFKTSGYVCNHPRCPSGVAY